MLSAIGSPFNDITNILRGPKPTPLSAVDFESRTPHFNRLSTFDLSPDISPEVYTPERYDDFQAPADIVIRVYQHNPYGWRALPSDEQEAEALMRQHVASRAAARLSAIPLLPQALLQHQAALALQALLRFQQPVTKPPAPSQQVEERTPADKRDSRPKESSETTPAAPEGEVVCHALVQFKCHQAEYNSTLSVSKGQYVVVQGDRGIDIGLVNRVNTDQSKQFIERTGPVGAILRHATTQEVEYWATDLKKAEDAAVDFCRQRVIRNNLNMEVRHAEYQYDKNKLTFYYEARSRVDFVVLLKELYRQFGCRIWMEKVRAHE